jgi:exopolyphosphatase/guanosine-5'-triphosphate,3'-diphosphate pyrophosphatase
VEHDGTGVILAGVDLGTLTCRLLIARVAGGRLTELRSERRILRLGEGVAAEGRLRETAVVRVLDTLKDWRRTIQAHGVQAEVAVATSAVRDALNRDELRRRARQDAGFDVEVLTGEEEARLTMLGIRSGLPPGIVDVLGLDIGGGSTELIVDRVGQSPIIRSLNLGVVRATEMFLRHDPPTADEIHAARVAVTKMVAEFRPLLGKLSDSTLVGTAGTITTLAAMAQGLAHYVPARIHNYVLSLDRIRGLEQTLLRHRSEERARIAGLEPGRQDVIVAGTLILSGVMETLGFRECLVSDLGLREGIVLDLADRLSSTRHP